MRRSDSSGIGGCAGRCGCTGASSRIGAGGWCGISIRVGIVSLAALFLRRARDSSCAHRFVSDREHSSWPGADCVPTPIAWFPREIPARRPSEAAPLCSKRARPHGVCRRVRYDRPCRGVAKPGIASALGAEDRWFESSRPDHFPAVSSRPALSVSRRDRAGAYNRASPSAHEGASCRRPFRGGRSLSARSAQLSSPPR